MAIPMIPNGMGYTEWAKRVHRPDFVGVIDIQTNLKWIRKNSRMRKIKRLFI
jgi:hypothetical protein